MNTLTASKVAPATDLIGKPVRNKLGESLGKIEDFVMDLESGQIAYAVLSFGGFLHIGDKLFAIPLRALSFEPDEDVFIVNVEKSALKNAPGFDKDDWPDLTDRGWGTTVFAYYGFTPYWE